MCANIPTDSMMLMSFVNMRLRDQYSSLDALCDDLDIDKDELISKLSDAGFEYSIEHRKFW